MKHQTKPRLGNVLEASWNNLTKHENQPRQGVCRTSTKSNFLTLDRDRNGGRGRQRRGTLDPERALVVRQIHRVLHLRKGRQSAVLFVGIRLAHRRRLREGFAGENKGDVDAVTANAQFNGHHRQGD
jgi:hypothetical protein